MTATEQADKDACAVQVKFVVNGEPIEVAVDPEAPLSTAVQQVLRQSNNTGRPFADWELRDDRGQLLATDHSFAEHAWLTENNYLYVTIRIGVGGAHNLERKISSHEATHR